MMWMKMDYYDDFVALRNKALGRTLPKCRRHEAPFSTLEGAGGAVCLRWCPGNSPFLLMCDHVRVARVWYKRSGTCVDGEGREVSKSVEK
jgi:hypothetical protein